jgi:flagellar hook-associated protein 1 FlgK
MPTLTSLLHVGASGLRAATLGVNVTSQNATNANTVGYTRRAVMQSPVPGPPEGGNGVATQGPRRIVDRFVERRLLGATSANTDAVSYRRLAEAANFVFTEGQGAITSALETLEASLRSAASEPGDTGRRRVVLTQAGLLAESFRNASNDLVKAREEADKRIAEAAEEVNQITAAIDLLQREIRKAEVTGVEASDLRDQRDQKVRELAALLPVAILDGPFGTVGVTLAGGRSLVNAEGGTLQLRTDVDPATNRRVVLAEVSGADVDITSEITSGEIGGLVAARDGVLQQAEVDLDQLAFDVAGALNAAQSAGFGLDGATGRNLYTPLAGVSGAARSLVLDPAVAGTPEALGFATDPTQLPGDNRGALALTDVFSTAFARGGTATPGGALATMVTQVGSAIQAADTEVSRSDAQLAQVKSLRDSVSATNSDDEMVSLMSYQRAYEASLRVVAAADEMLQQLVQLGAR